jgi:hypothetical protein
MYAISLGGAQRRNQSFASLRRMAVLRTFPTLMFCYVADAASVCSCGTRYTASQFMSANRSFAGIVLYRTFTALSTHGARTREPRNKAILCGRGIRPRSIERDCKTGNSTELRILSIPSFTAPTNSQVFTLHVEPNCVFLSTYSARSHPQKIDWPILLPLCHC